MTFIARMLHVMLILLGVLVLLSDWHLLLLVAVTLAVCFVIARLLRSEGDSPNP